MRPSTTFIILASCLTVESSAIMIRQIDNTTAILNNSIFNDVMVAVTDRGFLLVDAIRAFQLSNPQTLDNITGQSSDIFSVMKSAEQEMATKGNLTLPETLGLLPASIGVSVMVHSLAGALLDRMADFNRAGATSTMLPLIVEARDRTTALTQSFDSHLPDLVRFIVTPFDKEMLDQLRNVINIYTNQTQIITPKTSVNGGSSRY